MLAADAAELSHLFRDMVGHLSYYNELARREEIAHYTEHKLIEKIQDDPYSVVVAIFNDQIIGFCFNRFDDYTIWLEWIITRSGFQHQGVGTALIAKLAEFSKQRNCHKIWCDCRTSNEVSKHFLEKNGFEFIAMIANHWYQQDFVLLHKLL